MHDFTYHRATSVADVVARLKADTDAKILAGGQSLVPILKLGLAEPSALVSLRDLGDLRGIHRDGDDVVIGAAATHAQVAGSADVAGAIPALAHLAGGIGDPQVRNRGTLGGSIAHADPAADYPAALLGLGATVVTDRRSIAADDFFTSMFATALELDEVVTAVRFPVPAKAGYAKFPNPASRFAVVGVFVSVGAGKGGVRVAVTGAGTTVFRAGALEQALGAHFAADALDGVSVSADDLVTDLFATAEYRAHLVGVMARRAVAACG